MGVVRLAAMIGRNFDSKAGGHGVTTLLRRRLLAMAGQFARDAVIGATLNDLTSCRRAYRAAAGHRTQAARAEQALVLSAGWRRSASQRWTWFPW